MTSVLHVYAALANAPTGSLGDMTGTVGPDTVEVNKWTELTAYCRGGRIKRGISAELGKIEAGELTQELNNLDHRFDPDNPDSPYYGYLDVKRRIRVTIERDSIEYVRYTGFIMEWPNSYESTFVARARVQAFDLYETQRQGKVGKPYQTMVADLEPT